MSNLFVRPVSVALALLVVTACRERARVPVSNSAPADVQRSFQRFTDSVTPRLARALDSAGYHAGSDPTEESADSLVSIRTVGYVTPEEARARLFNAGFSLNVHRHNGGPTILDDGYFVSLDFVTAGEASKWALLVKDGYLHQMLGDTAAARLPLDLELAIRSALSTRVEIRDWWAFEDDRLGKSKGAAQH